MSRLIESIYLENGIFRNLTYHEARMDNSLLRLYGLIKPYSLVNLLSSIKIPSKGLYKCRILYDINMTDIEFIPYLRRQVSSLKIISASLVYDHKFENRSSINELFRKRGSCNDIIIIKDGFVTDSSYGNLVFRKREEWYTPTTYLLNGTMRQSLIDSGKIMERVIRESDIFSFESVKIINAMRELESREIMIDSVCY